MASTTVFLALLSSFVARIYADGVTVSTPNQKWDYSYPYQSTKVGNPNLYYGSSTYYDFSGNSGACGIPWAIVNSRDTAAVPEPRYSDLMTPGVGKTPGAACGSCYLVKCLNVPRYANKVFCTGGTVKVTIVDYDIPGTWNGAVWPNNHFDMKPASFQKIAQRSAGIVNVKWKRVSCGNSQPKFTASSSCNFWFKDFVVYNIPKTGVAHRVYAKLAGKKTWTEMKRSFGAHFIKNFLVGNVDSGAKVYVYLTEKKGQMTATYKQIS